MSDQTIQLPVFKHLKCFAGPEPTDACRMCCDLGEEGRAWRRSLGNYWKLPEGKVDFDRKYCPRALGWTGEGEPAAERTDEPQAHGARPDVVLPPMPERDAVRRDWWGAMLRWRPEWWVRVVMWIRPGNVIARLARRAGFDKEAGGGCSSCGGRQAMLNGLGWWRCVLRPWRVWAQFGAACAEWGVTRRAAIWRGVKGLVRKQPRVQKPESGGQT
jgi:hypothetical protein